MADYSTIKGFTIQSLATDPVASEVLGGTWASGGNLNTPRAKAGGLGIQTAAMYAGGIPAVGVSETYNGTAWTEGNNITGDRGDVGSAGTTTAGLIFGGSPPSPGGSALNEEYDGTSWSEQNNLPAGIWQNGGCGTQTAACSISGYNGSPTDVLNLYDGTSWTTSPATLNTSRYAGFAFGTTTAAVYCSGYPPYLTVTENFNGTAWTESGDLSTGVHSAAGAGTQTAGIGVGGETAAGLSNTAEFYDGSTWSLSANTLATARSRLGSANTAANTAAMMFGGLTPAVTDSTEEFSIPSTVSVAGEGQVWYNSSSKVLKGFGMQGTGAWSSGGAMNTPRSHGGGGGDQTAATVAGDANVPASLPLCETYNGSAWTEVNNLTTSDHQESGSSGSSTSMGIFGGAPTPPAAFESWDGTSWTAGSKLNSGRYGIAGAGVSATSLLAMGGGDPSTANVEEYNGTSWAEGANLLATTQYAYGQMGSVTACLMAGGHSPSWPSGAVVNVEEWNGTSFTEGNNLNTGKRTGGSAGSTTLALVYGGALWPSGVTAQTESYNGTSWTEVGDLATPRYAAQQGQGVNAAMTALSSGGDTAPGKVGVTEEWSIPNATKTFTAS